MAMSLFSHCVECGRKLRNAFFCPRCGRPACSLNCMDHHAARHAVAAADRREPRNKPDYPIDPTLAANAGHRNGQRSPNSHNHQNAQ